MYIPFFFSGKSAKLLEGELERDGIFILFYIEVSLNQRERLEHWFLLMSRAHRSCAFSRILLIETSLIKSSFQNIYFSSRNYYLY
jgi:hypothetical protein